MRTYARINRRTLQSNFQSIRKAVGPDVAIMAVLKADAYGHGAVEVAQALSEIGATAFGVACLDEGIRLREAGVDREIAVLGGAERGEEPAFRKHRLIPFIHTADQLRAWESEALAAGTNLSCHLEIDTGMNRLGLPADPALLTGLLSGAPHLRLAGLATHLASAEDFENDQAEQQRKTFCTVVEALQASGRDIGLRHLANSAAIAYRPEWSADMVRPGLSVYGYVNAPVGRDFTSSLEVQPALEWKARITSIRDVAAGARLGYEGAYTAARLMRVAVLGVGYADGLSRKMSNGGLVLVNGQRCPIVGLVSMDVTLVDVTGLARVQPGDEATLIGPSLDAWEMARRCGSIAYEVLCGISARVPRIYA